jgi:hypothetical protein
VRTADGCVQYVSEGHQGLKTDNNEEDGKGERQGSAERENDGLARAMEDDISAPEIYYADTRNKKLFVLQYLLWRQN